VKDEKMIRILAEDQSFSPDGEVACNHATANSTFHRIGGDVVDGETKQDIDDGERSELEREIETCLAGRPIDFVPGEVQLSNEGYQVVSDLAQVLAQYPSVDLFIDGHTACEPKHGVGCACNLQSLSAERAKYVEQLLRTHGIACGIIVRGWGCLHPVIQDEKLVRVLCQGGPTI